MTNKNQINWAAMLVTTTSVVKGVTHFDNLDYPEIEEMSKALESYQEKSRRHDDLIDCDVINNGDPSPFIDDITHDAGWLAERGYFIPAIANCLSKTEDEVYNALVGYEADMEGIVYDSGHDFIHIPDVRYVIAKHKHAMILKTRMYG